MIAPEHHHTSRWAVSSLIAGLLWIALALVPIPFTTLLGLPLAGYAILAGWWSRRNHPAAWWGIGLGCGGLVYIVIINLVLGGLLVAGVIGFVAPLIQGTATP